MKSRKSRKQQSVVVHTSQWEHLRSNLPPLIVELSKLPGNEIDSAKMDERLSPYSEADVCLQCKINAAYEVHERLRAYNKRFVNLGASPYLSRLGEAGRGICTCKRPRRK